MAVGRRVRELRQQLQISQEELAARADLHRNYVGSVERGERDIGISAIGQLAHALGVPLADFFAPFRQRSRR
jgi:transcriptional regulator with XRE-family HTH domain